MLLAYKGQQVVFRFGINNGLEYYDPLLQDPYKDIYVSVVRGLNSSGSIIENAVSVINSSYKIQSITLGSLDEQGYQNVDFTFLVNHNLELNEEVYAYGIGGNYDGDYLVAEILSSNSVRLKAIKSGSLSLSAFDNSKQIARVTHKGKSYIKRVSDSEYNFVYTVPDNLFAGHYTVMVKTEFASIDRILEINFQVSQEKIKKTAKITSAKIQDGVAVVYTDSNHSFTSGDYVSIQTEAPIYNGNYYINATPSNREISYQLNTADQPIQNFISSGSVNLISTEGISPVLAGPNQPTKISYRPIYDSLQPFSTNSILLIGHADNLEINDIVRINSIQEAVNLIGADGRSPLLRAVFEAYNCGAKDIFICAAAPMSEYIEPTEDRNLKRIILKSSSSESLSFYEKYYERLSQTYSVIRYYEFIDIVVPVEASMIRTNGVDFTTQLAAYCTQFHNETGFVQIGVIGSRSNGIKDSDVQEFESNKIFKNKFTTYDANGEISSDIGRFIVPVYGELNFNHTGFPTSYTGTAAASFAGIMSNTEVYMGIIRKRLPAGYSVYGANLSAESLARLDNMGINTVYRSRRATRGNPYEVYVSNDYTMASRNSVFSKLPQVRLAAMVINEIKSIGYNSIGKFAYETVTNKVRQMLNLLVAAKAINDYSLDAYADRYIKGSMIFQLTLISSLNLKTIKFSVTAGPGA